MIIAKTAIVTIRPNQVDAMVATSLRAELMADDAVDVTPEDEENLFHYDT